MSLLIWNDSYSVENDLIDSQHKILFEIFNTLHDKCCKSEVDSFYDSILQLQSYTRYHFRAEEQYMAQINYKKIIMHKLEHRYFENRVDELTQKKNERSVDLLRLLITFLSNWLLQHVVGEDRKIPPPPGSRQVRPSDSGPPRETPQLSP